jgi:hypothetical protein
MKMKEYKLRKSNNSANKQLVWLCVCSVAMLVAVTVHLVAITG